MGVAGACLLTVLLARLLGSRALGPPSQSSPPSRSLRLGDSPSVLPGPRPSRPSRPQPRGCDWNVHRRASAMFVAALSMAGTPAESPEPLESDYPSAIRIFHGHSDSRPEPRVRQPQQRLLPAGGGPLCALRGEGEEETTRAKGKKMQKDAKRQETEPRDLET